MFTGIIQAVGEIVAMEPRGGDLRLRVNTGKLPLDDVALDRRALVAYSSYYVLSDEYIVNTSSEVTSSTKLQD